jgi:nitroimidazol reductase NimA-like FMN-containing flavoprotein (pyridoxamine 5'-phosphate oxidase superfamily)
MTTFPVRRADRVMSEEDARACLERCLVGHVGTVGADGTPYVTPMSYVYAPRSQRIYLHLSTQRGHLLANLEHSPKVCFQVERAGPIVQTGPNVCDASQVYQSVVCFGTARMITVRSQRERVCRMFGEKYTPELPADSFPSLDTILVVAIAIEQMIGKRRPMPPQKW